MPIDKITDVPPMLPPSIYVFHRIVETAKENIDVDILQFKRILHFLRTKQVVYLDDYDPNNEKHAVLRFDDGTKDLLDVAPLLHEFRYPFEVFVCGDRVKLNDGYYMNTDDLKKIVQYGGRLQYHSKSHPKLDEIPEHELENEIRCPDELKSLDPAGFRFFAYPYWRWNDNVIDVVKQHYVGAISGNGFARAGECYALDSVRMNNDEISASSVLGLKYGDILVKYIEPHIPVTACNFRCNYCYVGHTYDQNKGTLPKFIYSPEHTAKALSQTRLGGKCLVGLCGAGETLLPPELPSYIKAILNEGHFVAIVSNMSLTKRIDELLTAPPEHLERLFFKCSFHWHELKRLNLLDVFDQNIKKVRAAGCSVSVEITPYDELIPDIAEVKAWSMEYLGALPHITIARDEINRKNGLPRYTRLPLDEYRKVWGQFGSALFDFKDTIFEKSIHDFCYAGVWRYTMDFVNGDLHRCYSGGFVQNIYKDINAPIQSSPIGCNCKEPHCYNGHALLTMGCVPTMKTPSYADVRDRICTDGSHWLSPRMAAFFAQKLYENNKQRFSTWQLLKDYCFRTETLENIKKIDKMCFGGLIKKIYKTLKSPFNK